MFGWAQKQWLACVRSEKVCEHSKPFFCDKFNINWRHSAVQTKFKLHMEHMVLYKFIALTKRRCFPSMVNINLHHQDSKCVLFDTRNHADLFLCKCVMLYILCIQISSFSHAGWTINKLNWMAQWSWGEHSARGWIVQNWQSVTIPPSTGKSLSCGFQWSFRCR